MHPRLWRKLNAQRMLSWTGKSEATALTDARLKVLVRRACGIDADGITHKLASLRVTYAPVTLRGVLAALRGPRDDTGKPLLRGAVRTLQVAGLPFPKKGAGKLVKALNEFMRPPRRGPSPNLDVWGGVTPCTHERPTAPYQYITSSHPGILCGRMASVVEHACEQCDMALCGRCCDSNYLACEHMCGSCGRCEPNMAVCLHCDAKGQHDNYCARCMCLCNGDCGQRDSDEVYCDNCDNCVDVFADLFVWCSGRGCKRVFCKEHCAFGGFMRICHGCFDMFCADCKDANLAVVGGEAFGEPRQLCLTCRRVVQPATKELLDKLHIYDGSSSSGDDGDDDGGEDDEDDDDEDYE